MSSLISVINLHVHISNLPQLTERNLTGSPIKKGTRLELQVISFTGCIGLGKHTQQYVRYQLMLQIYNTYNKQGLITSSVHPAPPFFPLSIINTALAECILISIFYIAQLNFQGTQTSHKKACQLHPQSPLVVFWRNNEIQTEKKRLNIAIKKHKNRTKANTKEMSVSYCILILLKYKTGSKLCGT